ncbi:hypothetical protein GXP67_11730 [Rhodocytophaga rosea]|uniref:Uncharacterized protein n=1 Tax=Rhodocytophaga rosea TaxID=2704465 RepID=A0A6C0GHS4_9BACT|nr:hypothetical protein [Rhodocytophaga rosea]QHT67260.1 hypothetical protein GXP67_11730 [Rhodocytophaga rosea]
MNQKQLNVLTMCKAVLAHLDSKPAVWNGFSPLVSVVHNFRTSVLALHQQNMTQAERSTVGYTKDRNDQLNAMCDLAFNLLLKIRSYARITNNQVLLHAIDYSESHLRRGRETEVINRCQLIHDRGKEHLVALSDFVVTPDMLTQLQRAIDTFSPLSAKRDIILGERTTATANIPLLIENIRKELRTLDDLIAGLIADKDFVTTYGQVRQIVDRGAEAKQKSRKTSKRHNSRIHLLK